MNLSGSCEFFLLFQKGRHVLVFAELSTLAARPSLALWKINGRSPISTDSYRRKARATCLKNKN